MLPINKQAISVKLLSKLALGNEHTLELAKGIVISSPYLEAMKKWPYKQGSILTSWSARLMKLWGHPLTCQHSS